MVTWCPSPAARRRMAVTGAVALALNGCAQVAGIDGFGPRPSEGGATGTGAAGTGGTGDGGAGGGGDCSGPHEFRHAASGHCYYFEAPFQVPWPQARDLCAARGPGWTLASVSSLEEHVFLIAQLHPSTIEDVWVGGNDIAREGVFVWESGEPWDYEDWSSGEPNNGLCSSGEGEDCVELELDSPTEDGDFSDECCDEPQHFVCERP